MKLKLQRIAEHYRRTRSQQRYQRTTEEGAIRNYFGDVSTGYLDYTVADNSGEIAAQEYIEFVSQLYFSPSGSWLGILGDATDQEQVASTNRLRTLLNDELINSRFYPTMTRLIREGVLYKNAIMDVSEAAGGLNLEVITGDNTYISMDKGDANKCAFTTTHKTKLELIQEFQGEEIDRLKEMYMGDDKDENYSIELMTYRTIVTAIIPRSEYFGTENMDKKFKYVKLYFIDNDGVFEHIKPNDEEQMGYFGFPFINYSCGDSKSMAEVALPFVIETNRMKMQKIERIRYENRPVVVLDKETLLEGAADLSPGGTVGVTRQQASPQTLSLQGPSSLTNQDIADNRAMIDRIFKIPYIRQVQNYRDIKRTGCTNNADCLEASILWSSRLTVSSK